MNIPFLVIAVVIVASGIAAVSLRNLVHCALALTVTFVGLAAAFLLLGAEFVGFAQILVYVGAVAILVVFAILLTRAADEPASGVRRVPWMGVSIALVVFGTMVGIIQKSRVLERPQTAAPALSVKGLGHKMMEQYVLPLEIIGLLLTAALIGAAVIAMQDKTTALKRDSAIPSDGHQPIGAVAEGRQRATSVAPETR